MSVPDSGPLSLPSALADLAPVLDAPDVAVALAALAALAARRVRAPWCGAALFSTDGGMDTEGWAPGDAPVEPARRALLRQAWTEHLEGRELPDAHLIPFESGSIRQAAIVLPPASSSTHSDARVENLAPLLRVAGLSLHARVAGRELSGSRDQYQRWFRTLDEQVRVLDRERQKFAAVVQQSDACVFVTDESKTIRWMNNVMRQKHCPGGGGEWLGQSCSTVCHAMGQEPQCAECPIERSFRRNELVHREFRWEAEANTYHHYLTALPIRGADGQPKEVMVTIQDLGDLGTLRRSEARYRMLFERSNKAILLVNPTTGRIVQANPTAARMTGFDTRELARMHLRSLHAPEEWQRLEPHYTVGLRQRVLEPRECRIRARDGAERIAMVAGARYEMGDQDLLMIDLQDVTERRRVEEALRKAENSLRTVIEHAPIVLFAIDSHGIFTMSEGRGLEALGLRAGQVVGSSVFDIYGSAPELLDLIRRALGGEEFTATSVVAGLTFETHYSPIRDDRGRVTAVHGVAIDVTERRRLEEQLVQSQKMEAIGRLAGGVAHDFNSLLAVILGHSELMLADLAAGDPLREGLEEIHRAGGRGALLTRQLLAFSRRDTPAPAALDVGAVVTDLDAMLRRLLGEDIRFEIQHEAEPCVVKLDRGQLEQTILNLVINARDALPEGGWISVRVRGVDVTDQAGEGAGEEPPGRYVCLSVIDDGTGMDDETMAHAFEPFFTTKRPGEGTGLGLSTVYGIAERNRGWVKVSSKPGMGSTFEVYLPRIDAPACVEPPAETGELRGGRETILLVEDEPAVRNLVAEALRQHGYTVLTADDGVGALELAGQHPGPVDLLLTDVVMPRMGGGELAQLVAESRQGLRVLFMSGYTDDAVVRHGVEEARVAFLQKPFRLEDLARKVRQVLDTPAAIAPETSSGDPDSAAA